METVMEHCIRKLSVGSPEKYSEKIGLKLKVMHDIALLNAEDSAESHRAYANNGAAFIG